MDYAVLSGWVCSVFAKNITYVNRSHSFEDALLDAYLQIGIEGKERILLGTFDEIIESSNIILERLGVFRNGQKNGEGAIFMELTSKYSEACNIKIEHIEFSNNVLSQDECIDRYAKSKQEKIVYNNFTEYGIYPTVSARIFYDSTKDLERDEEMIFCNNYLGMSSSIIIVKGV